MTFADAGEAVAPGRIIRTVALLGALDGTAQAVALMRADTYRRAIDATYDPQWGWWLGTIPITGGTGEYEIELHELEFDDQSLDVDSNGRFNALDVVALDARVGSTDPNDLRLWDFEASSVIDSDDVAVLNELVGRSLDSGILGDINGDGNVDCAAADIANYNYNLSEPGYFIELDADLDGDADTNDFLAIQSLWDDCNSNSILDSCDIAAGTLHDANGDGFADECQIPGDFDNDGDADLEDYAVMMNCLSGPGGQPSPTQPTTLADCLVAFDADGDQDVDLNDFGTLARAFGK